jgi:uncharacterized protein (TIGR02147 family)
LKKLGFVGQTNDGTLVSKDSGQVDESSVALAQKIHYEQMAELAAQSLYTQGPETQDFESITLSLPADKVGELRAKVRELVDALNAANTRNPADAVFQINVQFFALTKSLIGNKQEEKTGSETHVA